MIQLIVIHNGFYGSINNFLGLCDGSWGYIKPLVARVWLSCMFVHYVCFVFKRRLHIALVMSQKPCTIAMLSCKIGNHGLTLFYL